MNPLLLLLLLSATPQPTLLTPGSFHGTEVQAADGAPFLALCEGGTELRLVQLRVQQVEDPVLDREGGVPTGKEVSAPCEPLVLLRDVQGVRQGPVERAQVTLKATETASPGIGPESARIELRGGTWRLERTTLGETGFRLTLHGGPAPVVLYEVQETDDGSWEVLWAGDLNHDGGLDLVLSTSRHYNVLHFRLFLSGAEKGSVREAAVFEIMGC
ncbi:hypothetical protein D187_002892 [Cystobacter fuscus DSM 2262]|uniref:Uncharacterized protein n=1 Tax=Cystobacter fuscus (strain ATCC 25194 / DSM 2262 / NBRC 100088 / M29) TaxID=1242864 RepID=S9PAV3_CYSF2|nr:hypothetical protein [Cystobacter fuscus]EPX59402.1 hypothetical protein D187_002892 [Cystobacter fuscus DSM 2262]